MPPRPRPGLRIPATIAAVQRRRSTGRRVDVMSQLRTTAVELSRRYREWGLWDDQTLGALIESGLRRGASSAFRVRSREHPWSGTLGDVHLLARRVAGGLRARGIGPGDVVALQLPN